ncbi:MAG: gliding motility lipoprotein GldH [Leadbetterella sp.]
MNSFFKVGFLSIFLLTFLWGCNHLDGFKEIRDFSDNQWKQANEQTFILKIKKEDVGKTFTFYYLIRNAGHYPFSNLYLDQKLVDPANKVVKQSTDQLILFDPKTGKPLGDGLGDMYDHSQAIPSLQNVVFPVEGVYKWSVKHKMRPDPLQGILSIGLKLEAVKKEL